MYVPGAQVPQTAEDTPLSLLEYFPSGQPEHSVLPIEEANFPARQDLQLDKPDKSEKKPT